MLAAAWAMQRLLLMLPLVFAMAQAPAPSAGVAIANRGQQQLDQLLSALRSAPSEDVAGMLEARIEHLWLEAGSPAVDLLMSRGMREMGAGAASDAEQDFDAALALDPANPEVWHRRAVARFDDGDTLGAIADIGEALQREPRNFAALDTLTRLSEAREDWKGAYAAWQKKLEIDPKTPGGEDKLKDLRRRALGDDT
jgi:tetratricopeptide (TPR) repeat protein